MSKDIHQAFNTYFRSAFTVDNVIFGFDESDLKVLLIKRDEAPYHDYWALPGYFVQKNEDLKSAAKRVLHEVTGLKNVWLEQVGAYGKTDRHSLGRVITIAYYSLVKVIGFNPIPASPASEVKWQNINEIGELAFDHAKIISDAFNKLKKSIRTQPIGFELLPPAFTLTDLQQLYEAIWQTQLEKRNFRKKILSMNLLIDLDQMQEGVAHRPARLYRFDEQRYNELLKDGFLFELKESKRKN